MGTPSNGTRSALSEIERELDRLERARQSDPDEAVRIMVEEAPDALRGLGRAVDRLAGEVAEMRSDLRRNSGVLLAAAVGALTLAYSIGQAAG